VKEANLAAYKKKKEGKVKPAAKSIVTLDVKPWGESHKIQGMSILMLIPCHDRRRDQHERTRSQHA